MDLNRNWGRAGETWGFGERRRDSSLYQGRANFSEPETRALAGYLREQIARRGTPPGEGAAVLDVHCCMRAVLLPLVHGARPTPSGGGGGGGGGGSHRKAAPIPVRAVPRGAAADFLAQGMARAMTLAAGVKFHIKEREKTWTKHSSGMANDYIRNVLGVNLAYTVEVQGNDGQASGPGDPAPPVRKRGRGGRARAPSSEAQFRRLFASSPEDIPRVELELLAALAQAVAFLSADGARLALSAPPRCDGANAENCTEAVAAVDAAVAAGTAPEAALARAGIVPAADAAAAGAVAAKTKEEAPPLREYCGLGVWMPVGACAAKRRPAETQLERRLDDPRFVFETKAIARPAPPPGMVRHIDAATGKIFYRASPAAAAAAAAGEAQQAPREPAAGPPERPVAAATAQPTTTAFAPAPPVMAQRELGFAMTGMLCVVGACFFLVRRGRGAPRRRVVEIGARNNRRIMSGGHSSGGVY